MFPILKEAFQCFDVGSARLTRQHFWMTKEKPHLRFPSQLHHQTELARLAMLGLMVMPVVPREDT
ncbi:hypothetical protein DPMN_084941 [Dreissena polymorpha]|uniref:Uncharacterized protein n=1 Tax=Dreissena polymorpha TaxID=45954 RepID=A0A9D3YF95_DREPO|nr:hypothetical protein DPMN_084941 [Dreissena polymorpha]